MHILEISAFDSHIYMWMLMCADVGPPTCYRDADVKDLFGEQFTDLLVLVYYRYGPTVRGSDCS